MISVFSHAVSDRAGGVVSEYSNGCFRLNSVKNFFAGKVGKNGNPVCPAATPLPHTIMVVALSLQEAQPSPELSLGKSWIFVCCYQCFRCIQNMERAQCCVTQIMTKNLLHSNIFTKGSPVSSEEYAAFLFVLIFENRLQDCNRNKVLRKRNKTKTKPSFFLCSCICIFSCHKYIIW